MFVWSSSASPVSEVAGLHAFGGQDLSASDLGGRADHGAKEIRMLLPAELPLNGPTTKGLVTNILLFQTPINTRFLKP